MSCFRRFHMTDNHRHTNDLLEEFFELAAKSDVKTRKVVTNQDGELVILLNSDDLEDITFYEEWQQEAKADPKGASLVDRLGKGDMLIVRKSEEYKTN